MKLHILSDLHTEFSEFEVPDTNADVVVLAGDIGAGTEGIGWAARQFPAIPVIYVPGNHEFYGQDIRSADLLSGGVPGNIRVLNDKACVIDGIIERFQPELWIHGHKHVACDYEIWRQSSSRHFRMMLGHPGPA